MRFATLLRAVFGVSAAAALGACASARPEIALPAPRTPAPDVRVPNTDSPEPIVQGPRSFVSGTIDFLPRGTAIDLGATVVSLRPRAGRGNRTVRGGPTRSIASVTPEFAPSPMVVRPGQPLVLRNGGPLIHRLFTPALAGRVIALDPGADSVPISLRLRGPVRFYCSLHADETFVVFVEDAPYVSVVTDGRTYRFGPVEPGRYTLTIWSERVSGPIREVYVDGYSRTDEPILLVTRLIQR